MVDVIDDKACYGLAGRDIIRFKVMKDFDLKQSLVLK